MGEKGKGAVFAIAELSLGAGRIGICPMPGRTGRYGADLATILAWGPDMVLTMTTGIELEASGADSLAEDMAQAGIDWRHLPITDFGAPGNGTAAEWPAVSAAARALLARGGRVLAHCYGGCGRSGMALLRLMVDSGEAPDDALARLRAVRPCAVETGGQMAWATGVQMAVE